MPDQLGLLNGRNRLLDIFPDTPGLQAPGSTASRVSAVFGKVTRKDLQADPVTGRPFLYALDPLNVTAGIQPMPPGTIISQIDKRLDVFGQLEDGTYVPLKRRRGRRMNPANHRATSRAIRRVDRAVDHAKKLFRSETKIRKSVKRKRKH